VIYTSRFSSRFHFVGPCALEERADGLLFLGLLDRPFKNSWIARDYPLLITVLKAERKDEASKLSCIQFDEIAAPSANGR
jgi:hypothetical protein